MHQQINTTIYASPAGELLLGEYDRKICICDWVHTDIEHSIKRLEKQLHATCIASFNSPLLEDACSQLNEYFRGLRKTFELPLLLTGTSFQKSVWDLLTDIPYGSTETYASLALRAGNPKATRAVASANGANIISVFLPCHRVIGSNGKLTGYSGGLTAKRILLEIESSFTKNNTTISHF